MHMEWILVIILTTTSGEFTSNVIDFHTEEECQEVAERIRRTVEARYYENTNDRQLLNEIPVHKILEQHIECYHKHYHPDEDN